MQFKIDENLHPDVAAVLRQHGHDALTVWDERAAGASDAELAGLCRSERRALITLDLGFADIRQYPPGDYAGLVVLRLRLQSRAAVLAVIARLLPVFEAEPLAGQLWIVAEHGLRVRSGA